MVQPHGRCDIDVIADDSPRILLDGEVIWSDGELEDLVAGFEDRLYRAALAWHKSRQRAVFHAAALVSGTETVVLSGPSGAGKSSLALAAVRRGWKYFSDEFVVTDGARVWGWPRAIRFDPPRPEAARPDYLMDLALDDETVGAEGTGAPYHPIQPEQVQRTACLTRAVRFVHVERSDKTVLTPLSPVMALKHWTEAAFFEPTISLGPLVGADRAWRASWRHPDELIDLIERT